MKNILLLFFFQLPFLTFAQDDLLSGLDSIPKNQKVEAAFKAMKIVNLESTKLANKGDFYFFVAHRFGSVQGGFEDFFGLDNAVTQIKFLYGINDWLTSSIGRSEMAYDLTFKYSLWHQLEDGFPVTIVGFNSISVNIQMDESDYPKMTFEDQLSYVTQVLISRKFNKNLSLEIAPTFFHENFVESDLQDNSQYALGFGGRYKITKRWSINMDYNLHLNRASDSSYKNPFSIGADLETGGHVFQMFFTSSQGIHEAAYLGHSTGDWMEGEIYFGFNLYRVF